MTDTPLTREFTEFRHALLRVLSEGQAELAELAAEHGGTIGAFTLEGYELHFTVTEHDGTRRTHTAAVSKDVADALGSMLVGGYTQ